MAGQYFIACARIAAHELEKQAKAHLASSFQSQLEEKDEMLGVLQTQVSILRQATATTPVSVALPTSEEVRSGVNKAARRDDTGATQ